MPGAAFLDMYTLLELQAVIYRGFKPGVSKIFMDSGDGYLLMMIHHTGYGMPQGVRADTPGLDFNRR